ncbi:hypothetical protein DSCO28_07640 [Desulfosarcina ovata subsp. sediminis]|uniref:Uncharacterized protein n=1 Tax=Desulfosarcina ovata subsp. sediminis TaxID=885957 RepID=A0A5K7ZDD4_9BACT|nr:hypothetical protein [Desulfosarcina ovata]BBO80198.1 hypothetical protein DSCO28_07640 [Desulfosarcina ovata subsp. sediminis]
MKTMDMMLVTGFLISEQDTFYTYLEDRGFDGDEATVMIDDLLSEIEGCQQACVDQFGGLFEEWRKQWH